MKRLLAGIILVLGTGFAAQAQDALGSTAGLQPVSPASFSTSSEVHFMTAPAIRDAGDLLNMDSVGSGIGVAEATPASTALAIPGPVPSAALSADPDPVPTPKFLYGGRDDYRWQLGFGVSFERFTSSIFNASAVGFNTSISYYLNNWLGIEGNAMTGFAPTIFDREHVKLFNLTGGPRIAWRQRRWEPWLHGLVGLAHEQPQTAGNSRNAFGAQLGGGVDYRLNPRLSFRIQADWLHTTFFGESQNNLVVVGGAVLHF